MSSRNAYLKRTYGLTEDDYNDLLLAQGGGCAICGKTPETEGRQLAVDHLHRAPYKVRGLLCYKCNHFLVGKHHDSELVRRMADYLDRDTGFYAPAPIKKRRTRASRARPRKTDIES